MTTLTAALRTQIIELYVATFGRAPDATGLGYWCGKVVNDNWTIGMIARSFFDQTETQAKYPSSQLNSEYIDKIYTNVLGRTADTEGKAYWQNQLDTGLVSRSDFIVAVVNAAKSSTGSATDKALLENKTSVAEYYSVTLGLNDTTKAATVLSGVTSDTATVTTGKAAADTASATSGTTFTLTTGIDAGTSFTGTTGNDTFVGAVRKDTGAAAVNTLNAADSMVGGSGTDTLQIAATGTDVAGQTVSGFATSAVEKVSVQNASAGTLTLDMSGAASLATLVDTSSSAAVVATALQNIVDTEVTSVNGANLTMQYANSVVSGTADSAKITLNGAATTGNVTVTVQDVATTGGVETLSVVTSGAASGSSTTGVTLTDPTLKTLNVSGDKAAYLTTNLSGATATSSTTVGTVNASTMTGNLDINLTGAGGQYISVTGGKGDDTLRVATLSTNSTIAGGDGTDTLAVNALAGGSNDFKNVSGIEKVQFGASVNGAMDLSNAGAISTVVLAAGANGGSITGVSSGLAVQYNAGATTFTTSITNATSNTTDALTVNLGTSTTTAQIAAGTLTANGVETVTLTSNSKAEITATNHTITLADNAIKTLNISGNESLQLGALSTSTLTSVDASKATAAVDLSNLTLTAAAVTIAGGTGNDIITGGTGNDSLVGNDGNDQITGGNGNDVMQGGAGNDTLIAGGTGNDSMDGGAGNDIFQITSVQLTSADTIAGGDGANQLQVTDGLAVADSAFTNVTGIQTVSAALIGDNVNVTLGAKAITSGVATITDFVSATTGLVTGTGTMTVTVGADYTGTALAINIGDNAGSNHAINASAANTTLTVSGVAGAFDAADAVTGGAGTADKLVITADNAVANLSAVAGFESITVNAGSTASSTVGVTIGANSVVTNGRALTIDAASLTNDSAVFTFDGSAETADGATNTGRFSVTGGAAADVFTGGAGADTMAGAGGADSILGGDGNDSIDGGAGADTLRGQVGDDNITGAAGNDTIDGGAGADTLSGGDGNDLFIYSTATDSQVVNSATQSTLDTIDGFDFAADTIAINVRDSAMQVSTVTVGTAALTTLITDLAASGNLNTALRVSNSDAALVTVSAGTAAGTYLVINADRAANFSGTGDTVIKLTNATNTSSFSASNFVAVGAGQTSTYTLSATGTANLTTGATTGTGSDTTLAALYTAGYRTINGNGQTFELTAAADGGGADNFNFSTGVLSGADATNANSFTYLNATKYTASGLGDTVTDASGAQAIVAAAGADTINLSGGGSDTVTALGTTGSNDTVNLSATSGTASLAVTGAGTGNVTVNVSAAAVLSADLTGHGAATDTVTFTRAMTTSDVVKFTTAATTVLNLNTATGSSALALSGTNMLDIDTLNLGASGAYNLTLANSNKVGTIATTTANSSAITVNAGAVTDAALIINLLSGGAHTGNATITGTDSTGGTKADTITLGNVASGANSVTVYADGTAVDSITGGTGNDTVVITGRDSIASTKAIAKLSTGTVDTLTYAMDAAKTLTVVGGGADFTGIESLIVTSTTGAVSVGSATKLDNGDVSAGGTINLSGVTGAATTLGINGASAFGLISLYANGTDKVTVVDGSAISQTYNMKLGGTAYASADYDIAAGTGTADQMTIDLNGKAATMGATTNGDLDGIETIIFTDTAGTTGTIAFTADNTGTTNLKAINASAITTAATIDVSTLATAVTVTGGSGSDTIKDFAAAGTGHVITLGSGSTGSDTIWLDGSGAAVSSANYVTVNNFSATGAGQLDKLHLSDNSGTATVTSASSFLIAGGTAQGQHATATNGTVLNVFGGSAMQVGTGGTSLLDTNAAGTVGAAIVAANLTVTSDRYFYAAFDNGTDTAVYEVKSGTITGTMDTAGEITSIRLVGVLANLADCSTLSTSNLG